MGRKSKSAGSPTEKKSAKEVREQIREYMRKERDTILIKWMALEESVRSEDYRREAFYKRREREDTKCLPLNIQKFIGTLKRSVRKTIAHKGGTAYSIIRNMFLYWDADKSGEMSAKELRGCMNSLGVRVSDEQLDEIVGYYDSGKHSEGIEDREMNYQELLQDVTIGEPTIIEFGDFKAGAVDDGPRFDEVVQEDAPMPRLVELFVEAVRNWVMNRMRVDGGTPFHHIRFIFNFYDYDYSNGLNREELLLGARKGMNLSMTEAQADGIIKWYNRWVRDDPPQMRYEEFLKDVCANLKPVLHTVELTSEERQRAIKALAANPFQPVPFKAPANKIVEDFKKNIKVNLHHKINTLGGTVTSWLTDAFLRWDIKLTRKINDFRILQGAAKRLHVTIDEEQAMAIMRAYDKFNTGEMHYLEFIKDVTEEEGSFLKEVEDSQQLKTALENSSTARCPPHVQRQIDLIRASVETFARKSGGVLQARDLLHGSLLRFDSERMGMLTSQQFSMALRELNVQLDPKELRNLMLWFDCNGSNKLDYNAVTKQMFGEDVSTKQLALPKLNKFAGNSNYTVTNTYNVSEPDKIFDNSHTLKAQTKVMLLAESRKVRKARLDHKRTQVYSERAAVVSKLRSVEEQRKKLLDDFHMRREQQRLQEEERKRLDKMAAEAARVKAARGY